MRMNRHSLWLCAVVFAQANRLLGESALVFQTDFGLKDGAVSAMKGVAHEVDPRLKQYDITHEIPAYNVWEAGYRLKQTTPYWPAGTVFVNVVDPGVGTERRAVVARTRDGHFIVTPDNGTLTFLAESPGLEEVRVIDIARQRRRGSEASYTFHGRDVFAYVGARLASGQLAFADVGSVATSDVVKIPYTHAELHDGTLTGPIPVLDPQYGNVWSGIPKPLVDRLGLKPGDILRYRIRHSGKVVLSGEAPFVETFGKVPKGNPLLFLNSLLDLSLAVNQGNFAAKYHIQSGPEWSLEVTRKP
jgi:S-adenosylmethionine hydrolase